MMNWNGFHVLSRLSYGMYLNQFHVIDFIPKLKPFVGVGLFGFAICWTLSLVGSLGVAYATFAIVELPFLKWREYWLAGRRNQIVAARWMVISQPAWTPNPVPEMQQGMAASEAKNQIHKGEWK